MTCCLCGYPAREHVRHQVPLAWPDRYNLICLDCAEELGELAKEYHAEQGKRRVLAWLAGRIWRRR